MHTRLREIKGALTQGYKGPRTIGIEEELLIH